MEKFKDRISAGFIGGIIAGVVMNIVDWLGYLFNFHDELLLNWASVVTLGRLPNTLGETILAQVEQIFFAGFINGLTRKIFSIPPTRTQSINGT